MNTLAKIARALVIAVLAAAAVYYGGAQLLSDRAVVERSITIAAPPDRIWPLISDFQQWPRWAPWNQREPALEIEVSGDPGALGHSMRFLSADGSASVGVQEIVDVALEERVETAIDFGEAGVAVAVLEIEPVAGGSRVVWRFQDDLEGADQRWFGLALDNLIGPDYESGLLQLKAIAEAAVDER